MVLPVGSDQQLTRTPWATVAIIALSIFNYLFDLGTDSHLFELPVLVHASIWHLGVNMFYLWVFGSYLEDRIGRVRFVLFYAVCELGTEFLSILIFREAGIGASGAISGIMGLFLVRFYAARIRTVFPVGPLFWRVDIPARALLVFWFSRELVYAFLTTTAGRIDNIGYWAHVGGFLTGMILGKLYRYDVEGKLEDLFTRARRAAEQAGDRRRAERLLLSAVELAPGDPEPHLRLGRLLCQREEGRRRARRFFRRAVDLHYRSDSRPAAAGLAFLEMVQCCGDEKEVRDYLRFGRLLGEHGEPEAAAALLRRVMDRDLTGTAGEKILRRLATYAAAASQNDLARQARTRLAVLYPGSSCSELPRASPGPGAPPGEPPLPLSSDLEKEPDRPFWPLLEEATSQPLFWLTWSLAFAVLYHVGSLGFIFLGGGVFALLMIYFLATLLALGGTYLHLRSGEWAAGILYGTGRRKGRVEAQRDFNIAHYFDRGALAEKNQEWAEAIRYYRGVLAENPRHLQARFNLARIYHRHIHRPGSAIAEYEALRDHAPEGHVFRREAEEAIAAIRSGRTKEGIKPLEFRT